jgi:hypothetical protein
MASRKRGGGRYARLLDAWSAPQGAGRPIACVASTFTFDAVFFEEECLARFLRLETNPSQDGIAYLIEREEKLAEARVGVLVDRRHVEPLRSLRWDLLAVRVPGGLQHSKVILLVWERTMRVVVASANLTESGYCLNREVFGALDYIDGGEAPRAVAEDAIAFLRTVATRFVSGDETTTGPKARALEALEDARQRLAAMTLREPKSVRCQFAPGGAVAAHGSARPLQRVAEALPQGRRPSRAVVVSPFFDEESPSALEAVSELLLQYGSRSIDFGAEGRALEDGRQRLHLPAWVGCPPKRSPTVRLHQVIGEDDEAEIRPLHAKMICLEREGEYRVSMIGSSNFTRAGLSLGDAPGNLEANLVYSARRDPHARRLAAIAPALQGPFDPDQVELDPLPDPDADVAEGDDLPAFFGEVLYCASASEPELQLTLAGDGVRAPQGWVVRQPGGSALYDAAAWERDGRPEAPRLPWQPPRPPSHLEVRWTGEGDVAREAHWIVNVERPSTLPPPSELRDLPLDTLLTILTSAQPLHVVLRRLLSRQTRTAAPSAPGVDIDPLKRFEDRTALLHRTRATARALDSLRERLERPCAYLEALRWRLHGPVGPVHLAKALAKEARSPGEAAFLITEVALTVARSRLNGASSTLAPQTVDQARAEVIRQLQELIDDEGLAEAAPDLHAYVREAMAEVAP